jgi:hypothetical protein
MDAPPSHTSPIRHLPWVLLPALILGVLFVCNYAVLTRHVEYANQDFMTFWAGGRAVLEGLDSYDPDIWFPLQARYGSVWNPNRINPYPLWTDIIIAPLALLKLDAAAAMWLALSEGALTVSLVLLVVSVQRVSLPVVPFLLMLAAAFASRWTLITLINGQMSLFLTLTITVFLVLMQHGKAFWAGGLLALIALKPSPFVVFVPLLALWLILHRRWAVVTGGAAGLVILAAGSWLVQPGWLTAWLAVRDKLGVTSHTPTVWGLAFEIAGAEWWPLLGLALVIALTVAMGMVITTRRDLSLPDITALAIVVSLFTSPYAWPYENTLLFIPLALLYCRIQHTWQALLAFVLLAAVLPWAVFPISLQGGTDTLSFVVILTVGTVFAISTLRPTAAVVGQHTLPGRVDQA